MGASYLLKEFCKGLSTMPETYQAANKWWQLLLLLSFQIDVFYISFIYSIVLSWETFILTLKNI